LADSQQHSPKRKRSRLGLRLFGLIPSLGTLKFNELRFGGYLAAEGAFTS
jgi:hypothetical protein